MVTVHSYVSLPEGKLPNYFLVNDCSIFFEFPLNILAIQWEGVVPSYESPYSQLLGSQAASVCLYLMIVGLLGI